MRLRAVPAGPDVVPLWRDIHNAVIPAQVLTSDEVLERRTRNSFALLAFAARHGFVEFDRYVLDGETIAYVDLYLAT